MNILDCHREPEDYEDCINYYLSFMIVPRTPPSPPSSPSPPLPPSSPNLPPFSPPRQDFLNFVEEYFEHNQYIHYVFFILVVILLLSLVSVALCCSCSPRRAFHRGNRRINRRNDTDCDNSNGIPMVTIVIHPDETSSLADDVKQ